MEEANGIVDLHKNAARQLLVRASGSSKPTSLLGRSSSRNSPPYRRLNSSRTPPARRESKSSSKELHWIRNNRVLLWLMLITVWAYIGFHVQSIWVHGDHQKAEFDGYKSEVDSVSKVEVPRRVAESLGTNVTASSSEKPAELGVKDLDAEELDLRLGRKRTQSSSKKNGASKKSSKRSKRRMSKVADTNLKGMAAENSTSNAEDEMTFRRNTSYGLFVGPFGKTEEIILGWGPDKRTGTCHRKSEFARTVWSRSFLLIFHELSMTGAPISMMELASELLSCGATVSAVVLIKKGGLLPELDRRGIKVLKDRTQLSFKAAMKADLVIAGSAVCSSWVEQYLKHFPAGSTKIVWWIMENRRQYFERSKHLISRVKMLIFLSSAQLKMWLSWCEEEHIHLDMQPMIVPLSVNDELAFVAGIPCSLNTPAFSVEKMLEKKDLLRAAVRKEMGLSEKDMLVMSLSSINPTKGQRLFLESALMVAEHNVSLKHFENNSLLEAIKVSENALQNNTITMEVDSWAISQTLRQDNVSSDGKRQGNATSMTTTKRRKHKKLTEVLSVSNHTSKSKEQGNRRKLRNLFSKSEEQQQQSLKILIGSVGSKSNKVLYVKAILRFLSQHSNLSKLVLWTPATTRVASLYAAADVYVINAQGLGETFGRVTIEAMAFGLPVLGTDAGGTQEIVEHNLTGLLHPVGSQGTDILSQNIQYLLSNPSAKEEMGMLGRKKVQEKYLKNNTYKSFAEVLVKCMKIK